MSRRHKKRSAVRKILGLILFLTIISAGGAYYLYQQTVSLNYVPANYTASNEQLNNPYCGWYHTYNYEVSDDFLFDETTIEEILKEDNNTRLCQICIDLKAYRDTSISSTALMQIQQIFEAWSKTDKQMIVRFFYGEEPEDLTKVYLHMEQVANIVNKYASHIYTVQGVFVGEHGEPKDSKHLSNENLSELTQYWASLIDSSLFLALQNAHQYFAVTGLTIMPPIEMAYTEVLPARLGLFHDGIVTGASEADTTATKELCQYAPSGGALGEDAAMYDIENAIQVFKNRGLSYFSADINPAGLEKWKTEAYRGDQVYDGVTAYDYMTTHLGYRYVVKDARVNFDTWKDDKAVFSLRLKNEGFANAYRRFDTTLVLKNKKTDEIISLPIDKDNRQWKAGEEITLKKKLDVRNYERGEYQVYLMMMDSSTGEMIRLGNQIPITSNGYKIGTLELGI